MTFKTLLAQAGAAPADLTGRAFGSGPPVEVRAAPGAPLGGAAARTHSPANGVSADGASAASKTGDADPAGRAP